MERVTELNSKNKKENRSSRIKKGDFQQPSGSVADRVMFFRGLLTNKLFL
jgi:hypothetical protein